MGQSSAERLLDAYDGICTMLTTFPALGSMVEGTLYRWHTLDRFVVVYSIDDDLNLVTLMRLFHMSSDWRARLLHE